MYEAYGSPLALSSDPSKGITPGNGRVLYVSGLGAAQASDDNEGSDPQFPLSTITEALTRCTQRRHDYIFVQDFYDGDTFPILFGVRDVHLIGLGNGVQAPNRILVDGGGAVCFEIGTGADGMEIAGFELGSAGVNCIEVVATENCWKVHIHHCAFGYLIAGRDGIFSPNTSEFAYCMVDSCWFDRLLTRDALSLSNPTRSAINHNYFKKAAAGKSIVTTAGELGSILGNVFSSLITDALAAGWAVDIGAGTTRGMIAGNKASAAGSDAGNNPYIDRTTGNVATLLNTWADNFDGPGLSAGPDTA